MPRETGGPSPEEMGIEPEGGAENANVAIEKELSEMDTGQVISELRDAASEQDQGRKNSIMKNPTVRKLVLAGAIIGAGIGGMGLDRWIHSRGEKPAEPQKMVDTMKKTPEAPKTEVTLAKKEVKEKKEVLDFSTLGKSVDTLYKLSWQLDHAYAKRQLNPAFDEKEMEKIISRFNDAAITAAEIANRINADPNWKNDQESHAAGEVVSTLSRHAMTETNVKDRDLQRALTMRSPEFDGLVEHGDYKGLKAELKEKTMFFELGYSQEHADAAAKASGDNWDVQKNWPKRYPSLAGELGAWHEANFASHTPER